MTFTPSDAVARVEAGSLRTYGERPGGDVVSLAVGEPDFDTPAQVKSATVEALRAGHTHYANKTGDKELRTTLAERLSTISGRALTNDHILVTHGGSAGIAAAILSTVNPGDVVVIPDPTYSLFADVVHLAGGTCVRVPGKPDFHWDLDALTTALRGAKVFLFCNPCNPTGVVHTKEELDALAELLNGTDTLVIADEAYSALVYDGYDFTSVLSIPQLAERSIYCQTFSKSYAMTGWRLGYLAGPPDFIRAAARIHSTFNGAVNTFVQRAAIVATTVEHEVDNMRKTYAQKRRIMLDELSRVTNLTFHEPGGSFYVFARYPHSVSSVDFASLLREHGVLVRPGAEFGPSGDGHIRLSYATSPTAIRAGVQRIARCVAALDRHSPKETPTR